MSYTGFSSKGTYKSTGLRWRLSKSIHKKESTFYEIQEPKVTEMVTSLIEAYVELKPKNFHTFKTKSITNVHYSNNLSRDFQPQICFFLTKNKRCSQDILRGPTSSFLHGNSTIQLHFKKYKNFTT